MDASPRTPALRPGDVIGGRYRLERIVASGGMASVWEAHDDVLARRVAVKVLHAHLGADEQFVARFKREAVAAARLAHPSIVAIYDTCSEDGLEAIVMELVRGRTLRDELDRIGRFTPHEATRVVGEVADALAAAHATGIVHRDIKPANVLLSDDGRVLVADFGIAKAADGLDLTGTGATLGTAKYLAPEQVDSAIGPVDARADVYACGVILYELLCGVPPFVADTEPATAFARLHRDPTPPSEVVDGVPAALEAVVLRALARQPGARFADAAELRDALRDALLGIAPADGPPTAPVTVLAPDRTTVVLPSPEPTTAAGGAPAAPVGTATAAFPPPGPPATRGPRRKRRWGPIVMWSIIVIALGVAGGLWLGTGDDGDPSGPGATTPEDAGGDALGTAGTASFDPEGDGEENDGDTGAAVDGNPGSAWSTECYTTTAFGNLKDGVGLVVELASAGDIGEVRIESPSGGWTAAVFVADEAGADIGAWGAPVGGETGAAGTTAIGVDGAEGRFVLVWFTALGEEPSPACQGANPFGVSVSELSVV